jgi:hypothetical protein
VQRPRDETCHEHHVPTGGVQVVHERDRRAVHAQRPQLLDDRTEETEPVAGVALRDGLQHHPARARQFLDDLGPGPQRRTGAVNPAPGPGDREPARRDAACELRTQR